jgi:uncharacterized protein
MMFRKYIPVITILLILFASSFSWGRFPKPAGYVNDFANILDPEWERRIDSLISDLESKTTAEISVVTVENLSPYSTVEEYAEALFSEWKIGKAKKDNGVLILVSMKERKIRVETGYGIEPIIPDGVAGDIIRNEIAPNFKSGKYGEGLYRGTYAIAEKIARERGIALEKRLPLKLEKIKEPYTEYPVEKVLPIIFLIVFIIVFSAGCYLFFCKGRGRRNWSSGMFGGGFGGDSGGGFSGGFGGFGGGSSGGGGASGDW